MSTDIKPGDLVMVVRPNLCCGASDSVGMVAIVQPNPRWASYCQCDGCGAVEYDMRDFRTLKGGGYHIAVLKKLEPPALADNTETQRELEEV